jgi:hypothetical protein
MAAKFIIYAAVFIASYPAPIIPTPRARLGSTPPGTDSLGLNEKGRGAILFAVTVLNPDRFPTWLTESPGVGSGSEPCGDLGGRLVQTIPGIFPIFRRPSAPVRPWVQSRVRSWVESLGVL